MICTFLSQVMINCCIRLWLGRRKGCLLQNTPFKTRFVWFQNLIENGSGLFDLQLQVILSMCLDEGGLVWRLLWTKTYRYIPTGWAWKLMWQFNNGALFFEKFLFQLSSGDGAFVCPGNGMHKFEWNDFDHSTGENVQHCCFTVQMCTRSMCCGVIALMPNWLVSRNLDGAQESGLLDFGKFPLFLLLLS
jgi:hypothetical protein